MPLGREDEVSKHQPPVVNVPCSQQLPPAVAIEPLDPKPLPGVRGQWGWGGWGRGWGQGQLWWGLRQTLSKIGVSNHHEVARWVCLCW